MLKLKDINIFHKKVLIRLDLNVPIKNGIIKSEARILAALPTITFALKQHAKVIIMSHLGRPQEGKITQELSLFPIYKFLKKKFQQHSVYFNKNYLNIDNIQPGELLVLENVRFNKGEKNNSVTLSKQYASLCDVFVMDAFATAHRSEASTCGVAKFSKISCAGPLLISELYSLSQALKNPIRPMISVIGGAKVSTKFDILNSLVNIADYVIVGGGIANTFIAIDHHVGKSLYEPNFLHKAKILKNKKNILIPVDSRVGTTFTQDTSATMKYTYDINPNEEIMDFGDISINNMVSLLKRANTILWNGPVGVFEFPNFRKGTEILAKTIANSNAFSIAGGGDTLSVIDMFKIKNNISYISTGGGAFLNFLEGKILPAVDILQSKNNL